MSDVKIKVLGGGCCNCETLLENAKEAVSRKGVNADIEYITDFSVIASYGIMSTPALMVNDKVVSKRKVLKSKEIEKFL
jgi:small redox-active disulfide protein 2